MRFRLAPRSMTLDDLELLQVPMFSKFRMISQIWETTTAKRMNIDPHIVSDRIVAHKCTFQRCIDYVDVVGRSSAIQCHPERVVKTDDNKKLAIFDN